MTAIWFIILGALNGFLSVALGAFAAHGLKSRVSSDLLDVFQTAARYEIVHALGLILIGILIKLYPELKGFTFAGWAFLLGILFFCGSLYLLVLTGNRSLGDVAPIGGLSFMVGWILLAITAFKIKG